MIAPNPASREPTSLYVRLSADSDRVRVMIFSASTRRVRDSEFGALTGGTFHALDLKLRDSLGADLANGAYHFVVQAYDGSRLADARAGTFFILR